MYNIYYFFYRILLYLNQAISDTLQVKNEYSLIEDLLILVLAVCKSVSLLLHIKY